jgi:hypothetical protein
MRFCCAKISSLSSLIWRRLTTPPGCTDFSEPYTAGVSCVVYRCFFLTSHLVWGCCVCALSPRKLNTTRIAFKRDPVCSLHERSGERIWAVCFYSVLSGRRLHLLQFSERRQHWTLVWERCQIFVSVSSREWFYVFPRVNQMFTFHTSEVSTPRPLLVSEVRLSAVYTDI